MKRCVLYERECIYCEECDICDLDPKKVCDNCEKCIKSEKEYAEILIDEIIAPSE